MNFKLVMRSLLFFAFILLSACSPTLKVNSVEKSYDKWNEIDGFVVFNADDNFNVENAHKITSMKAGESGFTFRCDYMTMINLIREKALLIGGNCIKITEHKTPDAWSTCHRIMADVYRIDDLWKFEKEIIWTEKRKLAYRDFKETSEDRPFAARTQSTIRYGFEKSPTKGYIILKFEAVFNTEESYMKEEHWNEEVLQHEQNHFDISEIYARKMAKKITESKIESLAQLDQIFSSTSEKLMDEWDIMNDKYDTEVYSNPDLELKWKNFIHGELDSLELFKNKKVEVQIRKTSNYSSSKLSRK